MNALVPLALYGWVPLVLLTFLRYPPRTATIIAYLVGWMFLPEAQFVLPGFPNWDKVAATNVGVFLGVLIFDPRRLRKLGLGWLDLPMLIWCVCPFLTSLANGLGAYDGMSQTLRQTVTWGLPYLVGRRYFSSWSGLRELAVACFVGGLVYVPLCLWEVRMSPQLHHVLYGFHQHDFGQTIRGGGFRPTVFMRHGLMVGLWMSTTALVGIALWRHGAMRRIGRFPMALAVPALVVTAVLCKSVGALVLLVVGSVSLALAGRARHALPVALLLVVPLVYMASRTLGVWSGENMVALVERVSPDRAWSLQYRLQSEDLLIEHALRRPLLGWGGFGRNNVVTQDQETVAVIVDGLWILALGQLGLLGLLSLTLALLLPVVAFARRVPPRLWTRPALVPAASLAVVLALLMVDNLFNAMFNPLYVLVAGGLPLLRLAPRGRMAPSASSVPSAPGAGARPSTAAAFFGAPRPAAVSSEARP